MIKTGKRGHIKDESIEKRAILYSTAKMNEARIRNAAMEKLDAV